MLHPNHYTKREITIGMDEIGRQALRITIPVILIFIVLFFIFWPEMFNLKSFRNAFPDNPFIVIGIVLGGIILHELLHGITWALSCKEGFRAVHFGIWLKVLTPYCHCKQPLKKSHYMAGGLMPGVLLGIFPLIIALFMGNMGFLLVGIFFTFAAGGDFAIIWKLRKENSSSLLLDHPNKLGCYLYEKKE
ncbi:MAG: DUF3267 domain-containing protein [Bacteroidales bacterium]